MDEAVNATPSHLFIELTSLSQLSFPTSSTRIRFTCLAASANNLAVGSTSGTVYLYSRYAARYRKSITNVPVQLIACKEGAIEGLAFSPNQKLLAIASSRGHVCIVNLCNAYPAVVLTSDVHTPSSITCLSWTRDSTTLFIADSLGKLSRGKISGRTVFRAACELVLTVDSQVVQLDCHDNLLLISTITRSYLYNIKSGSLNQVGSKLRSGHYGACFVSVNDFNTVIFCGRPGGRLWECDLKGCVYNTHHFKQLHVPPIAPLMSYLNQFSVHDCLRPTSLHHSKIFVIQNHLLVANGRHLFVIDYKRARISLICDCFEEIASISVCTPDVFILSVDGALRKYSLYDLQKAMDKIMLRECFVQAAQIVQYWPSFKWTPSTLKNLKAALATEIETFDMKDNSMQISKDALVHLADTVQTAIERLGTHEVGEKPKNCGVKTVSLPGGMLRVHRIMANSGYDDDFTFRAPSPRNVHRRNRSRSTGPTDRLEQNGPQHSATSDMICSKSEDSLLTLLDDQVWMNNAYFDSSSDLENSLSPKLVERNQNGKTSEVYANGIGKEESIGEVVVKRRSRKTRKTAPSGQHNVLAQSIDNSLQISESKTVADVVDDEDSASTIMNDSTDTNNDIPPCEQCSLSRSWISAVSVCRLFNQIPKWMIDDISNQLFLPNNLHEWIEYLAKNLNEEEDQSRSSDVCSKHNLYGEMLQQTAASASTLHQVTAVNPLLNTPARDLVKLFPFARNEVLEENTCGTSEKQAEVKDCGGNVCESNISVGSLSERETGTYEQSKEPGLLTMLAVVKVLLGKDILLEIMQLDWIVDRLTNQDWAYLLYILEDKPNMLDAIDAQWLVDIVCELGLHVKLPEIAHKVAPKVLDLNICCPCCSLPLKTTVTDKNKNIVQFDECGHFFHEICIENYMKDHQNTSLSDCIKCALQDLNQI